MRFTRLLPALLVSSFFFFAHAQADPLAVGAQAPAVSGTTDEGKTLNLGELYKRGYTLVYFFPRAETSGCTAQGCSLRDDYDALTLKGVSVVGVSTDTVEAQKGFREHYKFPFPLIADHDQIVIKAFGVPVTDNPKMGALAARQAYLIDKSGKIVWADYHASTAKQAEDVEAVIKRLGL